MTSMPTKQVSTKIPGTSVTNNFGKEVSNLALFIMISYHKIGWMPDQDQEAKQALPAGISDHDGKVLTKVKRRAHWLDMGLLNCCGIKFGWSSVIAIIPVIGDVIDAFMAIMVLQTCRQVEDGLPANIKLKMLFNIILDFVIGLVPLVGDAADIFSRANTRNAMVLKKYLQQKGVVALKAHGQAVPAIDPSDQQGGGEWFDFGGRGKQADIESGDKGK